MSREKIGFIGFGRMGSALALGFIKSKLAKKEAILAYDKDKKRLECARGKGIKTSKNARELTLKSDIIFIAVKPKDVPELLEEIKKESKGKLFVSIAAGVKIKKLEEKLNGRIIRVMPNTPCTIYQGACAYGLGKKSTKKDAEKIRKLLKSLGMAVQIKEELMDIVTGLSGSGPAYIYYLIKALADEGAKEGLSKETALKLAAQTAKGAAEMILKTGKTPEQLIDEVCSPGGTTIEGIKKLKENKVDEALKQAVKAAAKRSKELSKK